MILQFQILLTIELFNLTISGKSMNFYELNKKLTVARQNGFVFNQLNELITKFYSYLRYINIGYYLEFQIPTCHRQFFRIILQNRDYVESFSNDMESSFLFACQKWFNQLK